MKQIIVYAAKRMLPVVALTLLVVSLAACAEKTSEVSSGSASGAGTIATQEAGSQDAGTGSETDVAADAQDGGADDAAAQEAADEGTGEEGEEPGEASEGEDTGSTTGLANPWQTSDSASTAAQGAGLDGFDISESLELELGGVSGWEYQYTTGLVQADTVVGAAELCVRKGLPSDGDDVSGDYTGYAHSWTQSIKGLMVTCYGNVEGQAAKTVWASGSYAYSIVAYGQGDDASDFGLSADDINALVNSIQ